MAGFYFYFTCLFLFVWDRASLYSSDWPQTQTSECWTYRHACLCQEIWFSSPHFLSDFVLDLLTFGWDKPPRGQFGACRGWGSLRFRFLHLWVSHLSVTVGNSWPLPFQVFIFFLFSHDMRVAPLYISPAVQNLGAFFVNLRFVVVVVVVPPPSAFQFGNFLLKELQQAWLFFARPYVLYQWAQQRYSWLRFLFFFLARPSESPHHLLLPTWFCILPIFSTSAINVSTILILVLECFQSLCCV